jgi:hypothetical protein
VTITVVMPHAPLLGREQLYQEAKLSVANQTRPPDQFIIESDPHFTGTAATQNRALDRVTSDWIALLGDDDYFLPDHLETLEAHIRDDLDVIWPDFQSIGANHNFCLGTDFNGDALMAGNYIPGGGSLIRTAAARMVGGWCRKDDPDWHQYEDWVMWKRLHIAGCRFKHIHDVTWAYRFHAGQTGGQA